MTRHDFEHIDRLLRDEAAAESDDALYVQLLQAAPHPAESFVQSLEGQFRPQRPAAPRLKLLRRPVVLATVFLLLVGAVLAIDDLLSQVIDSDPGLSAVHDEGKGVDLNLTSEIDQFTVDIQWGYVDTQRISLGYVVQAHDAQEYTNIEIVDAILTLPDGLEIPMRTPGLQLIENNQVAGRLEASVVDVPLSGELSGHLTFRLAYAHNAHRTAVPLPPSGASTTPLEDWMLQTPSVAFDLHIPTEAGYTVQLDLTAEDAGIALRLREFQAAPSLGRARICFTPPQHPEEEMWVWDILNAELQFNGRQIVDWAGGRSVDGCSDVRFDTRIPLESGTWTLIVHGIDGTRTQFPDGPEWAATITAAGGQIQDTGGGLSAVSLPEGADEAIGMRQRIAGTWTFTFDAP